MTDKIELLPCPACGKTPHLQFDPNRRYFVECMECDIYLYAYTAYAPTCKSAWNDFVKAKFTELMTSGRMELTSKRDNNR